MNPRCEAKMEMRWRLSESSQLRQSPASFLLYQTAELRKNAQFRPTTHMNHACYQLKLSILWVRSPRPETEVTTQEDITKDLQSTTDVANFITATSHDDQVKYRLMKERKPSPPVKIPSKVYNGSKRKSGTYQRQCNHEWLEIFYFLACCRSTQGLFAWHVFSSLLAVHMKGRLGPSTY